MNKTLIASALLLTGSVAIAAPATNVVCNGCVGSFDIKDGGVKSIDIRNGAVTTDDIQDGTVRHGDLSVSARLPIILDAEGDQVGTVVGVGVLSKVLLEQNGGLYVLSVDKTGFIDDLNTRWYRDSLNGHYPDHPTAYFQNTTCDGQSYGHFGVNIESYKLDESLINDAFVLNGVVYPVDYNTFLDEGVLASRSVWQPGTSSYECETFTPVGIHYLLPTDVLNGTQLPSQAPLFDTRALFTAPFSLHQ